MTIKQLLTEKKKGCGIIVNVDNSDKGFGGWQCGQYYDSFKRIYYCKRCKEIIAILEQAIAEMQKQRQGILDEITIPKQFDKEFKACNCGRILSKDRKYCDKCKKLVCDMMDEVGAGILLGDVQIDKLQRENTQLKSENNSFRIQLVNKIKAYEELKQQLNQPKTEK